MLATLTLQQSLLEDIKRLNLEIVSKGGMIMCSRLTMKPTLLERLKEAQSNDRQGKKILAEVHKGEAMDFNLSADDILRFEAKFVYRLTANGLLYVR
ncbi:hypothetical protein U1Q18_023001 [Sarracenia purpurea var. burkii]